MRNKAVEIAAGFADALVFIDDDEVPSPEWLKHLVACQQAYGADVVSGPVIPHFMSEVPQWISTREILRETSLRDRHGRCRWARTGNVLIRMEVFDRIGLFDDRFALTGGEDSDFFMRLYAIRRAHLLGRRSHRRGMGSSLSYDFEIHSSAGVPDRKNMALRARKSQSPARQLSCVVRGVLQGIEGICHLLASLTHGRAEAVKGLQHVYGCSGVIAGASWDTLRTLSDGAYSMITIPLMIDEQTDSLLVCAQRRTSCSPGHRNKRRHWMLSTTGRSTNFAVLGNP